MKNILITGANGMLGAAVCNYFSQIESFNVFAAGRSINSHLKTKNYLSGDLTMREFVDSLAQIEFDIVIHCAALTDIEKCEREPENAFLINTEATESLVKTFPRSTFIYVSTDSVFDGKTGNYSEEDQPNPQNVYSQTKLAGEKAVKKTTEKHYILRTNMYGFHQPPSDRSLFEWTFTNLAHGNQVRGFSNVVFNPLYVGQLAEVIEKLIVQKSPFGIYNAVCNESLSKYEFIQKIAEVFNFSKDLIEPFEIPDRPVIAIRPLRTFLKNAKISNTLDDINLSIDSGFSMLYDDFSKFVK